MREMKFRAWRRNEKNMTYFFIGDWEKIKMLQSCENEAMQYTGLKDKNNIEIYEGDIIHTSEGSFEVYWDEDYLLFYLKGSENIPIALDMDSKYLEVIGNIYENKELLESKNV